MSSKQVTKMIYDKLLALISHNRNQWVKGGSYRWPALPRLYSSEKSANNHQQKPQQAYMTNSDAASGDSSEQQIKKLTQDLDVMTNEMKVLKEKNDDLLDKYRRSLADSENLRVRLNKQISDAKLFGIQGFCKDLLEVADTLGHATSAVPQEELTDRNPHLKSLYEGLTMTQASLFQVFKRHGLEPMYPLKEKFDPNAHEALFQKEDPSVDPNIVIEVTKLGYKLHDRVIRPALTKFTQKEQVFKLLDGLSLSTSSKNHL